MTEPGTVIDNRSLKKGEEAHVEPDLAARLVAEGRASHTTRVRVLRAGLFGDTWREAGDEIEVSESGAIGLHGMGKAEVIDPRSLSVTPPEPKVYPARTPKAEPFADEPRVSIRVKRQFLAGTVAMTPGDEPVLAPESVAARAVACGAAEFAGLRGLTERGKRFFQGLTNPAEHAPQY